MRLFLFFITVISVSAFSGPVKDFAPDQVGNTWKYQVRYNNLTNSGNKIFRKNSF